MDISVQVPSSQVSTTDQTTTIDNHELASAVKNDPSSTAMLLATVFPSITPEKITIDNEGRVVIADSVFSTSAKKDLQNEGANINVSYVCIANVFCPKK